MVVRRPGGPQHDAAHAVARRGRGAAGRRGPRRRATLHTALERHQTREG